MTTPAAPTRLRWAAVVTWMGVIFYLSSRSTLPRPPGTPPSLESVAGHLTVYAVLAALIAWALRGSGRPLGWALATAWTAAVLYGISDEIHQSFVPNRHPDVRDVAADAIGAAVAVTAVRWWAGRTR